MRISIIVVASVLAGACGGGGGGAAPGAGGQGGGVSRTGGAAPGGTGGTDMVRASGGMGGTGGSAPDAGAPPAPMLPPPDAMVATPDERAADPSPPDARTAAPDTAPPAAACTPGTSTGCPANYWCSEATGTCLAESLSMRWNFSHQCALAGPAGVRLFDDVNGGIWPAAGDFFALPVGAQQGVTINCIPGARICYGARGSQAPVYWGADLDDSKPCSDCCHTCGGIATHTLVCQ